MSTCRAHVPTCIAKNTARRVRHNMFRHRYSTTCIRTDMTRLDTNTVRHVLKKKFNFITHKYFLKLYQNKNTTIHLNKYIIYFISDFLITLRIFEHYIKKKKRHGTSKYRQSMSKRVVSSRVVCTVKYIVFIFDIVQYSTTRLEI